MSSPNESTASRLQRIGRRTDATIPEDRFQEDQDYVSEDNNNLEPEVEVEHNAEDTSDESPDVVEKPQDDLDDELEPDLEETKNNWVSSSREPSNFSVSYLRDSDPKHVMLS